MRPIIYWCVAVIAVAAFQTRASAAAPDEIAKAIKNGKAWLYSQQKNGNWETVTVPEPVPFGSNNTSGCQYTGFTAVCAYALLCSGDRIDEPHVASAISFLKKTPTSGVYALSFRCLVWSTIRLDGPTRDVARRDFNALLHAMRSAGPARGMFFYMAPLNRQDMQYDHSVSQMAMLAVWSMEQKGFDVPTGFWSAADAGWRSHQSADGGWAYIPGSKDPSEGKITASMTAAGVATLMITRPTLSRSTSCDPIPRDLNIDAGVSWLSKNFDSIFDHNAEAFGGGYQPYCLFNLSRIGQESGVATFGTNDWYLRGSDYLVKAQQPDGSWTGGWLLNPRACTSLAMLFLGYGSAPVIVNKLQYVPTTNEKKQVDTWNLRQHDMFNYAGSIGASIERRLNWQMVDVATCNDEALSAAPLLYISGNKPVVFTADQQDKLRRYVQRGGMILGNADCGAEEFSSSFVKLGKTLFPDYEFRVVPDDHPIFSHETYRLKQMRPKPGLRGLSNGVRELMLLSATDLSKTLNLGDSTPSSMPFMLMTDIGIYGIDGKVPPPKGVSYIETDKAAIQPERTASVARIKYAGNWDPEPGGWQQFEAVLHNDQRIDLKLVVIELGQHGLSRYKLAHLTGTEAVKFTPEQRSDIKSFVDGGGTLVVDAAGGSTAFAESIEAELAAIFGDKAAEGLNQTIPPADPLYHLPSASIDSVVYREFTFDRISRSQKTPSLRGLRFGGRLAVIYSREDMSAGLVGQPVDGIAGYDPASATQLMRNIVLSAVGK